MLFLDDVCHCVALQGSESLTHLRKLAQNFPTQETGGLGGIDEDDEVPGEYRGRDR